MSFRKIGSFWNLNSELGLLISPSKPPQNWNFFSSPANRGFPPPESGRPAAWAAAGARLCAAPARCARLRAAARGCAQPRAVVARGCAAAPLGFGRGCKREGGRERVVRKEKSRVQVREKCVYREERTLLRSERKGCTFCIKAPNKPNY